MYLRSLLALTFVLVIFFQLSLLVTEATVSLSFSSARSHTAGLERLGGGEGEGRGRDKKLIGITN